MLYFSTGTPAPASAALFERCSQQKNNPVVSNYGAISKEQGAVCKKGICLMVLLLLVMSLFFLLGYGKVRKKTTRLNQNADHWFTLLLHQVFLSVVVVRIED